MTQQAIQIAPETKSHTPGPWYVRQDSAGAWEVNVGPRDFDQCVAFMGPCKYIDGDAEANARLIAAAPDMLEQMQAMVVQLESAGMIVPTNYRKAIARAKGESK